MSQVPNVRHAVVPEAKIVGYLLSATHAFGRTKAAFFESFGFSPTAWQVLRQALLDHVERADIVKTEETAFGRKFIVEGPLGTPDGRNPTVRAVLVYRNRRNAAPFRDRVSGLRRCKVIKELDTVVLDKDLPDLGLEAGDVGTVVLVHAGGAGYEVEFSTLAGGTLTVATLAASAVRPIDRHEIAHVRRVAHG